VIRPLVQVKPYQPNRKKCGKGRENEVSDQFIPFPLIHSLVIDVVPHGSLFNVQLLLMKLLNDRRNASIALVSFALVRAFTTISAVVVIIVGDNKSEDGLMTEENNAIDDSRS
jgi:hypothetical protein